ncbi:MAG: hypothetical protein K1X67_04560 [Fimbriimonadaceae bacterium]|nr:hypothetical protein [Fimbriimonadaceae bacterium]
MASQGGTAVGSRFEVIYDFVICQEFALFIIISASTMLKSKHWQAIIDSPVVLVNVGL